MNLILLTEIKKCRKFIKIQDTFHIIFCLRTRKDNVRIRLIVLHFHKMHKIKEINNTVS